MTAKQAIDNRNSFISWYADGSTPITNFSAINTAFPATRRVTIVNENKTGYDSLPGTSTFATAVANIAAEAKLVTTGAVMINAENFGPSGQTVASKDNANLQGAIQVLQRIMPGGSDECSQPVGVYLDSINTSNFTLIGQTGATNDDKIANQKAARRQIVAHLSAISQYLSRERGDYVVLDMYAFLSQAQLDANSTEPFVTNFSMPWQQYWTQQLLNRVSLALHVNLPIMAIFGAHPIRNATNRTTDLLLPAITGLTLRQVCDQAQVIPCVLAGWSHIRQTVNNGNGAVAVGQAELNWLTNYIQ